MVEIERFLSERSDEVIIRSLSAISDAEFAKLVETVLGYLELKTLKSKPSPGFVVSECTHRPDGKKYVVLFSRREEPVTRSDIEGLLALMRKADSSDGLVLSASPILQDGMRLAEQSNVGLADPAKLAALLRRFDLDRDVVRAAERLREHARVSAVPGGDSALAEAMKTGYEALASRDFMKALDAFDNAIMLKEDYDVPWRLKGNTLDEMGYHEQALSCYKRALELFPESDETWFSLGVCLFALGRYTEEIACYDRALQYNPVMQKALINKGSTLHRLGKYQDALDTFDRVLKINYRLEKVHNNRGAVLHALGRTAEALVAYTRALELKHDYVEAWMNKGSLLYELGKFGEAFEAFSQMTQFRPEMAKGWYLRGLAARKMGNISQAKASFEHAVNLDPDLVDAKRGLEEVSQKMQERFTEVPRLVEDIFASSAPRQGEAEVHAGEMPEDIVSHVEEEEATEEVIEEVYGDRAELLFLLGRYDEAFEVLGESLRIEGENPRLLTAAGNVLWALGKPEAAARTYEHALSADRTHAAALFNLLAVLSASEDPERAAKASDSLRRSVKSWQARAAAALDAHGRGDFRAALDDVDAALAMEDLAALHNYKGLVRLDARELDGALESFEKTKNLPLDPAEAHNNAGVVHLIRGEFERASMEFDRAIKLQRNNPASWSNRGCVLYKLDRLREAVACFDESNVLRPSSVAFVNKGFAQLAMDLIAEALVSFDQSLKVAETAEAYNGRGIALERQGVHEQALVSFREALRVAPKFKDAQDNLKRLEGMALRPETPPPPPAGPRSGTSR